MKSVQEPKSERGKPSPIKIVILILAVLLALSAGGLAARFIYLAWFAPAQSIVTVPDNLIGEQRGDFSGRSESSQLPDASSSRESASNQAGERKSSGTSSRGAKKEQPALVSSRQEDERRGNVLSLYQGKQEDNQRFAVQNMFPGDTQTNYYCLKASHEKDITVFFSADVTEQTKALGDVLRIKVTHMETGNVLFDGTFADIQGREFSQVFKQSASGETIAYYQIDVSLGTSVGNDYQSALLKADFNWYVKQSDGLTPPPTTGEAAVWVLWGILGASALAQAVLLIVKRRKEDKRHERT